MTVTDGIARLPLRHLRVRWTVPGLAALLFLAGLLLRAPFVADYLVNWDAVNFALGVERFDVAHHQPHPPGYLGYIVLGRILGALTGDGVTGLVAASLAAGAAAPVLLFLFGRKVVGDRPAFLAAALLATSPLAWYYSEVALTYTLEMALAIPIVLLTHIGRAERSERALIAAGVLLAGLGAIRQTSLVLLAPVLVYGWLALEWRGRLKVAGATALGVAVGLVPLLAAVGGPRTYLALSSDLGGLTGGRTWVLSGNLLGIIQNIAFVTFGMALGMGAASVVLTRLPSRGATVDDGTRRLLLLWSMPALTVYVLVHTGQLGYVLLFLPAGLLWASVVLATGAPESRIARVLARAVTANLALFLVLPSVGYRFITGAVSAEAPGGMATELVKADEQLMGPRSEEIVNTLEVSVRQFDLSRNDAHWDALLAFVEAFDADTTALLASPTNWGSFRHLAYYQREYRVYGLGIDRDGFFGYLFFARGGRTNYEITGLGQAMDHLTFPPSVRHVLIPDVAILTRLDARVPVETTELPGGATVAVATVPPGSGISFAGDDGVMLLVPGNFDPGVDVE